MRLQSQTKNFSKIKKRNQTQEFSSDLSKILNNLKESTKKDLMTYHNAQNSEILTSSFYKHGVPGSKNNDISLSFLKNDPVNETPDFPM